MSDTMVALAPRNLNQPILPWTWVGSQVVNVQQQASKDPELETKIVTEIAGYGRQLGRIGEAVDVLLRLACADHPGTLDRLDPAEKKAVAEFKKMLSEIEAAKVRYATKDRIQRRINELQSELSALDAQLRSFED